MDHGSNHNASSCIYSNMEIYYRITLPEPCHEDWNAMTPKGCGRFCAACEKTVIDFTGFSDEQFISYFQQNGINACGRFASHQFAIDIPWFAFNEKQQKEGSNRNRFGRYAAISLLALSVLSDKTFATPPIHHAAYPATSSEESNHKVVKGTVTDRSKKPIAGAKVELKDSQTFATTDTAGIFSLPVTTETCTLKITCSGFLTVEKEVYSVDDLVVIELQQSAFVTGGIEKRPVVDITKMPEGNAPGVQIISGGGIPGSPDLIIRDLGSIQKLNKPLIMVDKKICEGNLTDIAPEKIKTIKVLSEKEAIALYGEAGKYGVMLVTLKKDKPTFWQRITKPFRSNTTN